MRGKSHKGFFITGTDTGVGKTFVASGLLQAFKSLGMSACPMKPVETGCKTKKEKLVPEDTLRLIRASGVDEPLDIINPFRLKHPLAPSVAAELEGITIKKNRIISAYRSLSKKYDVTLVEGAGGIMVPLYKKYLFLDLIKDLDLPLIIVSRPGLGTINHTLLTIEIAKKKGIKVLGVIINHTTIIKKGLAEKTNPQVIEKLGKVPVPGIVQYSKSKASSNDIFRIIAQKIIL
ncbi:MAG TPA: dethiobiotin synthase [Nitrospirae bacterium]|nr:ATP-dependent dethiobiotin synthetase BioD 1 [bacterium BMS3Abin10]GBE38807.1 ATP-dependent dethiobiotin synthetase BioD 1 [bacterium BMS3Bbin08]HDK17216.1 dethiobiotin synthase [Nitrospirota bacterium]HDK81159.1 dethiobiotin synthase [Nitrospirota bacterium]HDO25510.1 dethiobiotin synthase [Nitrospirota bacterium]